MSYMDTHAAFAPAGGIQELNFDEIEEVGGSVGRILNGVSIVQLARDAVSWWVRASGTPDAVERARKFEEITGDNIYSGAGR